MGQLLSPLLQLLLLLPLHQHFCVDAAVLSPQRHGGKVLVSGALLNFWA
jgi:hypothetical protein